MKQELKRERYLSREEVSRLERWCRDKDAADRQAGRVHGIKVWAIVDLLLATGIRIGELSQIRIGDLELGTSEPRLWIKTAKRRKKSVDQRDAVPLAERKPPVVKHLKRYLQDKCNIGESVESDAFLFTTKRGGQYTVRALQLLFQNAAEGAKLVAYRKEGKPVYYSVHSTRHAFAVAHYAKNKDLRALQKILRHSSIESTVCYADVPFEKLSESVNGLRG